MDIAALFEELQTVARYGLNYLQNVYDRERYERLLALSVESYSGVLDRPLPEIRTKFNRELGHIAPKLGSDAAIFDEPSFR